MSYASRSGDGLRPALLRSQAIYGVLVAMEQEYLIFRWLGVDVTKTLLMLMKYKLDSLV
jgi:hypothetical protein